jgi:hypothetical protein
LDPKHGQEAGMAKANLFKGKSGFWNSWVLVVAVVVMTIAIPKGFSQLLQSQNSGKSVGQTEFHWTLSNTLVQQLSRNATAGSKTPVPPSQGQISGLASKLKQQRSAAQITGGVRPAPQSGSNGGMLLSSQPPTTLLSSTSTGTLTPSRTQSATGAGSPLGSSSTPIQQNQGKISGSLANGALTQKPIAVCLHPAIKDVDGSPSGIVFSPGYTYIIHGCGFGNTPGAVYLMGVKQQANPPQGFNQPPPPLHSDWVQFVLAGTQKHQTQLSWSDTQIEATVDPNTSGFYDSSSATVVVVPGGSTLPQIQAHNFSFLAARADQTLKSLPRTILGARSLNQISIVNSGSSLAFSQVNDSSGNKVAAQAVIPSDGSLILPGHTIAVVREDNAAPFPGDSDSFDFTPGLNTGFELKDVQFFHADLTQSNCSSSGPFAANGNWNTSWYDKRFHVSWQEQSCGKSAISAYAMDVTVEGPRGVSPF